MYREVLFPFFLANNDSFECPSHASGTDPWERTAHEATDPQWGTLKAPQDTRRTVLLRLVSLALIGLTALDRLIWYFWIGTILFKIPLLVSIIEKKTLTQVI